MLVSFYSSSSSSFWSWSSSFRVQFNMSELLSWVNHSQNHFWFSYFCYSYSYGLLFINQNTNRNIQTLFLFFLFLFLYYFFMFNLFSYHSFCFLQHKPIYTMDARRGKFMMSFFSFFLFVVLFICSIESNGSSLGLTNKFIFSI